MDRIRWCREKGLRLIEPSPIISDAYLKKAENALTSMRAEIAQDWKIATAYYSIYFSLYSILMRIGVKSEIHSCTLEFARRFLGAYFNEEELGLIERSMEARIDSQYYVDRSVSSKRWDEMERRAPLFMVKCKSLIITQKNINRIRKEFLASTN
jgi:uncharacterized protein (UPF0332 family)